VLVVVAALILVVGAGLGGWFAMRAQVHPPPPPRPAPASSEQVVVKYAPDVALDRIQSFETAHHLQRVNELPKIGAVVYAVPAGETPDAVIGWFTGEAGLVAYAERNGRVQAIP
jgi:hypothetical protein